jgi:hypothetical protein
MKSSTINKTFIGIAIAMGASVASAQSTIDRALNSLKIEDGAKIVLQGGEIQATVRNRGVSAGIGNKGSVLGSIVAENGSKVRDVTNIAHIGRNVTIISGDASVVGSIVAR